MPRSPSETSEETAEARFRRILAEVRRDEAPATDVFEPNREFVGFSPFLSIEALFSIEDGQGTAPAGASVWSAACAWLEELDEPASVSRARQQRDESPEAILSELGLTDEFTQREIAQLRRLYMWRNHPDRHEEADRESATRRVAIANMLLDRAEARLTLQRRS